MKKPERLAIEYKTASYRRQSEILKQLWKKNSGLMYFMAKPVIAEYRQEFYQLMKIRFINAIGTYKQHKGKFVTHLSYQLRSERTKFINGNHLVGRNEKIRSMDSTMRTSRDSQAVKYGDTFEAAPVKLFEHGAIQMVREFLGQDEINTLRIYLEAVSMCKKRSYGHLKHASKIAGITREGFRQKFNRVIEKIQSKIKHNRVKYVG